MAAVAAVPLRLLNHMLSYPFSFAPALTHTCEGSVHDPLRRAHPPNRLSSADVPECSVAPVQQAPLWGTGPGLRTSVHANFYEKALFVKPTWRPLCGVDATVLPFALCFYPHFGELTLW